MKTIMTIKYKKRMKPVIPDNKYAKYRIVQTQHHNTNVETKRKEICSIFMIDHSGSSSLLFCVSG